jgi:hypothetical protein
MTDVSQPSAGKGPGRPAGSHYGWLDANVHKEMSIKIARHEAYSVPEAARMCAQSAYGYGPITLEALLKRLVRGYRRDRST